MLKDQAHLGLSENVADCSRAAIGIVPVRNDVLFNACPSQVMSVYQEGDYNTVGRWGMCFPDGNGERLEKIPQGYGFSPEMPQRSYSSYTTLLPSVSHCGRLYNGQEVPNLDPSSYHHIVSPNIPYVASRTPSSQNKLPVKVDLHGDSNRFGHKAGYMSTFGSIGGGSNFPENSEGFKVLQQGFESGGLWSDCSKPVNEKSYSAYLSSPTTFPKPIGSLSLTMNNFGMASHKKEPYYGFGSHSGPGCKYWPQDRSDQDSSYEFTPSSIFGMNYQNWPTLDEAKQGRWCSDSSCSCAVAVDTLSERNRGPRAFKPRSLATANGSAVDKCWNTADVCNESYNRLDFVIDFKDAKFFVIKSYSEDNVHKSIKYGIWASTQNGNKKLDVAYHEAKEKNGACPVFLLFSVNASAQFCGVAEMVGPVDFGKSVDYWQQDKWTGQFPVKWHIIKDVPNSQFRHIVLESNDNKPVTNSRDTQEVELEQGTEMLKIFKNYESQSSILNDFHFYDERQKAMQARKSRQQVSLVSAPIVAVDNEENPVLFSNDFMKKMSKNFAEFEFAQ